MGFISHGAVKSQELDCTVEVLSPAVQLTNKQVFNTLEKAITNFMNATKFTDLPFKPEEKIEMSIVFNIDKLEGQTDFSGSLQMVSSRPVYGSGYNTTMLRIKDKNVDFQFKQFEPLQYIEGSFTSNLSAILSFYAYMALGVDFDSFEDLGGTSYLNKALEIANTAQSSPYTGWGASEKGQNNRYWLVFQMMDEKFKPLRKTFYTYHRLGFDTFTENIDGGRSLVLESLENLIKVHKNQPNSYTLQVFMEAKRQEIIDLFKKAPKEEQDRVLKVIERLDVSNLTKYKNGFSK